MTATPATEPTAQPATDWTPLKSGALSVAADWFFRICAVVAIIQWDQISTVTRYVTVAYWAIQVVYLVALIRLWYWNWQLRLAKQDLAATEARGRELDGRHAILVAEQVVLQELRRIIEPNERTDEL